MYTVDTVTQIPDELKEAYSVLCSDPLLLLSRFSRVQLCVTP